MKELKRVKEHLLSGGYTCVLCKGDEVLTSTQRGVKPLLQWLESDHDLKGYYAADKVIGKATAFLYVLLGVKAVYAGVISKRALQVLQKYNIVIEYGTIVEYIINRKGDGICPFEEAVLHVEDADIAYKVIKEKSIDLALHQTNTVFNS